MNPSKLSLSHVGIAVASLEEAIPVFSALLGGAPAEREEVSGEKVRIASFRLRDSRIELLESTSDDSPIARFIAKRGPGIHHLALKVADLQRALNELERAGIQPVSRAAREGAGGRRIAFLHPRSTAGVLIELVEDRPQGSEAASDVERSSSVPGRDFGRP